MTMIQMMVVMNMMMMNMMKLMVMNMMKLMVMDMMMVNMIMKLMVTDKPVVLVTLSSSQESSCSPQRQAPHSCKGY